MAEADIRTLVRKLRDDRQEASVRVEKIDATLANLFALYPELSEDSGDLPAKRERIEDSGDRSNLSGSAAASAHIEQTRVSTRDAVLKVLTTTANWLTVVEIFEAATGMGWEAPPGTPDPLSVVRTALSRLASDQASGVQRTMRDGRTAQYRLTPSTPEAVPVSAETASVPAPTSEEGGGSHEATFQASTEDQSEFLSDLGAPVAG